MQPYNPRALAGMALCGALALVILAVVAGGMLTPDGLALVASRAILPNLVP